MQTKGGWEGQCVEEFAPGDDGSAVVSHKDFHAAFDEGGFFVEECAEECAAGDEEGEPHHGGADVEEVVAAGFPFGAEGAGA